MQPAIFHGSLSLLFSTVVSLMSVVVCGISPSVNAAYQAKAKGIGVKVQSVYNKLNGLEPQIIEALLRHGAANADRLIEHLGGAFAPLVPGYRVNIMDGNHWAATERRLEGLRSPPSAPLPGQALVMLDPAWMLAIDVFACEDGQAQERVMRGRLLATVISRDLWIADRKFCTLGLLFGLQGREADFAIRPHGNLTWLPITELCSAGQTETGAVFEQTVQLILHETLPVTLRRIVVRLKHPTRDGDRTLAVLSNLPAADASAVKIASLYQKRWRLERLFQVLEPCCHGEINPLAYPRAALLGFCMVLISDNLLAVLKAAMRRVHGAGKIEASISHDYLADEIRRV